MLPKDLVHRRDLGQAPLFPKFGRAAISPNVVVRQYAIGKGHSVSVLWRGGEVDAIFGFEKEADALRWIKGKVTGMAARE
jgi:hypothetical protein